MKTGVVAVRKVGQALLAGSIQARLGVSSALLDISVGTAAGVLLFEQAFDHSRRDQTRHPRPPPLLVVPEADNINHDNDS